MTNATNNANETHNSLYIDETGDGWWTIQVVNRETLDLLPLNRQPSREAALDMATKLAALSAAGSNWTLVVRSRIGVVTRYRVQGTK